MFKPVEPRALTSGSITRSILALAVPSTLSLYLQSAFLIVDIFWVGKIGPAALAGIGMSSFIIWSIFSFIHLLSVGINAIVARRIGEGNGDEAMRVARNGLVFGVIGSAVTGLLFRLLLSPLFAVMNVPAEVEEQGSAYMRIILLGITFTFLFFINNAIYRGMGDALTPFKILLFSVVLNAVLDPLLILGVGFFPRLGIEGAALASVISRGLGVFLGLLLLPRGTLARRELFKMPDFRLALSILKIGVPVAVSGLLFCAVYILLMRIASIFGTPALAAVGVGHKIESISFLTCLGFSAASSALVGQNLGAGNPNRAARSAWQSLGILSVPLFLFSILFFCFSDFFVSIFTSDKEVIRMGALYLTVVAVSQVFMGLEVTLEGAFGGAGNTIPPMIISIPVSFARIPLAYLLAVTYNLGFAGVCWSITLTTILKGILIAFWFSLGRWKRTKV